MAENAIFRALWPCSARYRTRLEIFDEIGFGILAHHFDKEAGPASLIPGFDVNLLELGKIGARLVNTMGQLDGPDIMIHSLDSNKVQLLGFQPARRKKTYND